MSRDLINYLKHTASYSYNEYEKSRNKAQRIWDMYHNRQYTDEQIATLEEAGMPKETFNIIRLFTRQLIGYYSSVVNTYRVRPKQIQDIPVASVINDTIKNLNERNHFKQIGDLIKLDGFLSGLFCSYIDVAYERDLNGRIKKDPFGRKIYEVRKEYVPSHELLIDPASKALDYSDAEFIHRFKWLSKEQVRKINPNTDFNALEEYYNSLIQSDNSFETNYFNRFISSYGETPMYLVVHSQYKKDDKMYSVYWCGDQILDKKELKYNLKTFSYRVVKLNYSEKAEYYGVFEDVYESQNAINQAILQLQLLLGGKQVFVEEGAVENIEEFTKAYKRVNAVIPVLNIDGIKPNALTHEIEEQYVIIDKAFNRIQRVLNINDSFLGMAFQYDSGKKVQLQQNATTMALRYIDNSLELYYTLDGWDTIRLIKQFYKAYQMLLVTDSYTGDRWVEVNKPIINPMTGHPIWVEDKDPKTGKPLKDDNGLPILIPLSDPDTDLNFDDVDLTVESVAFNNEDERNQVMIETILNGSAGQMLMSVNPSAYAKIVAMNVKTMKTGYSPEIAKIFEETSMMLSPQPQMQQTLGSAGGGSTQAGGLPNTQNRTNRLAGE